MRGKVLVKISIGLLLLVIGTHSLSAQTESSESPIFTWTFETSADSTVESTVKFIPKDDITVIGWSFNGNTSSEISPVVTFNTKQYKKVVATLSYSLNGETLKDTKAILLPTAIKAKLEDIPNVFTPNDDTVNDIFTVATVGTPRFILRIMSRSGALLYEHVSDVIRWDGRNEQGNELPEGIYYYIIEDLTESYEPATGFVYLFRGKK